MQKLKPMSRPKCLRCGAGPEWLEGKVPDEPERETHSLILTNDELSALIEACNHANNHPSTRPPRPPYAWAGESARQKLVAEEGRRAEARRSANADIRHAGLDAPK